MSKREGEEGLHWLVYLRYFNSLAFESMQRPDGGRIPVSFEGMCRKKRHTKTNGKRHWQDFHRNQEVVEQAQEE